MVAVVDGVGAASSAQQPSGGDGGDNARRKTYCYICDCSVSHADAMTWDG